MNKGPLSSIVSALLMTFLCLVLTGCHSSSKPSATAEIGGLAPDFSVTGITGHKLELSGYRGKVVLLNFWATWCGPCEKEIPAFVELQNKYGPQGLQILGLSMDDSAKPVAAFAERFKMNYPVAVGDAKIGQLYGGVYGLPVNFLIGRDGRIAAKYVGATEISVLEQAIRAQIAKGTL